MTSPRRSAPSSNNAAATAQMLTLGRDGSDYYESLQQESRRPVRNHHPQQQRPGLVAAWFGGRPSSELSKKDSDVMATDATESSTGSGVSYAALEVDGNSLPTPVGASSSRIRTLRRQHHGNDKASAAAVHHNSAAQESLLAADSSSIASAERTPAVHYHHAAAASLTARRLPPLPSAAATMVDGSLAVNNNNDAADTTRRQAPDTDPTPEDALQQDCSFFYQGLDDHRERLSQRQHPPRGSLRALLRPTTSTPGGAAISQPVFSYHDATVCWKPQVLAQYRARYQQLNQEYEFDGDEQEDYSRRRRLRSLVPSDLELQETTSTATTRFSVQHSSLLYSCDHGVLMRLPRDQVRLVMDPELQAGILSVEQQDASQKPQTPSQGEKKKKIAAKLHQPFDIELQHHQPPELQYVLTVPDNVYRRVVDEMAVANTPCFHAASNKMDIRVALAALAVVFFILFIQTLVWPVD